MLNCRRVRSHSPADRPALLVEFLNTRRYDEERLDTPADLRRWLNEHGFGVARVNRADLQAATSVRDALRRLVEANAAGETAEASSVATLNRALSETGLTPGFTGAGAVEMRTTKRGFSGVLAELLTAAIEAIQAGMLERLKICRADDCILVFYDRSKNRSGRWCDMAVCGNREKTRSYYQRKKAKGSQ